VVVLAGMEGALPTVIASLIDIPVIGVPIPSGYGYGGEGVSALYSMLQSCAPGLAVVNIGNGLGAGSIASLIARRRGKSD
ncbi:MAG: AIR carboxylase family protein, partial [Candidatus Thorarchaeota archaeon]|nr:AIR carboxylase family protein [Candidatus Thorarchaeota archaeon]